MNDRLPQTLAILVAATVAALLVPAFAGKGLTFLAGLVAINVVFAMAWNLLFNTAGLLCFGQAMFFAAGAYGFAMAQLHAPGLPFAVMLAAGALAGGVLAVAFGVVALRRSEGIYFAILTLAFSSLVHVVITKTDALGRNDGLTGLSRPVIDFGVGAIDFSRGDSYYYFIIVSMSAAILGLWTFIHSPTGRLLRAIRQDPARAAFLGADVQGWRLAAFVVSGLFTAFAGAVSVPWIQIVSPEIAHWSMSTKPVLFALLGGAGSFWGPAIGAILFSAVEYLARDLHGVVDMFTGLLLLVVVLAVPGGIMGLAARFRRKSGSAREKPGALREKLEVAE